MYVSSNELFPVFVFSVAVSIEVCGDCDKSRSHSLVYFFAHENRHGLNIDGSLCTSSTIYKILNLFAQHTTVSTQLTTELQITSAQQYANIF